jgi:predicted amidohydrolase
VLQVCYADDESVTDRIERVAELVREQRGADLIVLPELWSQGGFAYETWADRAETLNGPTISAISRAAKDAGAVVHAGSIIERGSPRGRSDRSQALLWNTSVVLDRRGALLARYRKIHRFGFGDGEPRLLQAGSDMTTVPLLDNDERQLARLGLATCYDLRFPEMFRVLNALGATIVVVPAAWPLSRVAHWTLLGKARAVENQSYVVQCNDGGSHQGLAMGGTSQVVSPTGEVLAQVGTGEAVLSVDLDMDLLHSCREAFPVLRDRRFSLPIIDPPDGP